MTDVMPFLNVLILLNVAHFSVMQAKLNFVNESYETTLCCDSSVFSFQISFQTLSNSLQLFTIFITFVLITRNTIMCRMKAYSNKT